MVEFVTALDILCSLRLDLGVYVYLEVIYRYGEAIKRFKVFEFSTKNCIIRS